MHIFNQGKYKSLHAQQEGELQAVRQQVLTDKDFRPVYHLAPPTGLLNDPNGLVFDGERYHIFYQWFPYDALHGMKHWQHLTTSDFLHFEQADLLIPDEMFESHGCYSGGAILWQDKIAAFYTGNTRHPESNERIPHQNLAIFSKEGKLLEKRCLLDRAPQGYTEHCRDPKPFITAEGKIRFVLGAQREDLSGTALLYEMQDLNDEPKLLGEINLQQFDNQGVFMWECPDLFQLEAKDIFIWSPQGKAQETRRFQNNYHATYAIGKLQERQFQIEHCEELDYGFDFYAPQSFYNANGYFFGWVGLPDLTYPTDKYQWHSMLTLPRQLRIEQGKLYQLPIEQIYQRLEDWREIQINGTQNCENLDRSYLRFKPKNQPFTLKFFDNQKGQHLRLAFADGVLTLDRSQTEQTVLMEKFGDQRHCEIADLQQVEIFFDRSVVEIFLNGGEKAMTSRFFIAQRENLIWSSSEIKAEIAYLPNIEVA